MINSDEMTEHQRWVQRVHEINEKCKRDVERDGFSIRVVINAFAYTVGMASKGLPDLIIDTRHSQFGYSALIEIATKFIDGLEVKGCLVAECVTSTEGNPVYFELTTVPLTESILTEHVTATVGFYKREPALEVEPMRLMQVIYSDNAGLLPYSPDYNQELFPQRILTYDYDLKAERPQ